MSQGSTWNIWDFHLHTPCSILNNQYGDPEAEETWEKFVEQIEAKSAEYDICAIGLTDYFTIEGYKKVLAIQNAGKLDNIFIFPNIEFRIDKVVYRSRDVAEPRRLNVHVLFSPEIEPSDIEEHFLHDIDFVYECEPFSPSAARKLKISNLTEFGQNLQNQHARFREMGSPFEIGCSNAIVSIDQIKQLLDNRFHGKYLLVLAEENLSLLGWDSQHHALRKQLIQMSHAIFSSNGRTRDFCLGKTHESIESYLDEFKSLKPCIWGCDSHCYEERFLRPDEERFCWVKADTSWEGLKQVLYEPEERVIIQRENPEPDKSIYTVSGIQIPEIQINNVLKIDELNIDMNPNLVTIIGGRGSGKTALLDLIASCFYEGNKLAGMENSFFSRLYAPTRANKRRAANQAVQIDLRFKSSDTFSKKVGEEEDVFEQADIIYLTQNHFDEYSANPGKLYEHIIDLVFEKYSDEKFEYDELEEELGELEWSIQKTNLDMEQIRAEIFGKKDLAESELKIKQGEMQDYLQRQQEFILKQGQKHEETEKLTQQLNSLRIKKKAIEDLLDEHLQFRNTITSFDNTYKHIAETINTDLQKVVRDTLPIKLFPPSIGQLHDVTQIIQHNESTLEKVNEAISIKINEYRKALSELEGISKQIAELHQKLHSISLEVKEIEQRIKTIINKEETLVTLNNQRFDTYLSIIKKVVELQNFLQSMITRFEEGKDEMLDRLTFEAFVDLRQVPEFLDVLTEKVNNRQCSGATLKQEFDPIFQELDGLMNAGDSEADFSLPISKIKDLGINLVTKLKKSVTYSDFYNALFRRFFAIGLQIEFNDKALDDLSMGERAIVLLKILLALDDKPLLIDQPEEHLDNRYIYNELKPAFRKAKTRRQIIIATHNANLVVNTDAEQIIIAEHTNGTLSYEIGTLENTSIREGIKTILEGGDEAFKKREEKYGYIF